MATYDNEYRKSMVKDWLLTNSEAALELRISVRHWHRLRQRAQLEVVMVGRRPRYWRSHVLAAAAAGRFEPDPGAIQSLTARACTSATTPRS